MKKLTIQNYAELQTYIALANYPECNSNTMTLLLWSNQYEVTFETQEHFAIVYSQTHYHPGVWLMPFCLKEHRKEALLYMEKRSKELGYDFTIYSMTKEFKSWLHQTFPQTYFTFPTRDADDYVYDRFQQESLVGKKMQKRRNHFHAFVKEYENRYVFKPIEPSDHKAIIAFLKRWKENKDPSEYETIDVEIKGILNFLKHWDELPILGSCIYVDDCLEAFNIVSYLQPDMVQIHVEKANKQIRGLYIAILKLFLETLPKHVTTLNREDDMGLVELRKTKTDMNPIYKVAKFACVKEPYHIMQATPKWKQPIKDLWLDRFQEETSASTTFYFDHCYDEKNTWICVHDDTLLSMVQLREMPISYNGQSTMTYFIVGVATNKDYEGCGYMDELLTTVFQQSPYKDCNYLCLQAYNWDLYKHLGFEEVYKLQFVRIDQETYAKPKGTFTSCKDADTLLAIYQAYTKEFNGYRIRDLAYYETTWIPYAAVWGLDILQFSYEGEVLGYVQCEVHDDECIVHECMYTKAFAKEAMLSLLCKQYPRVRVFAPLDDEYCGKSKPCTTMAVRCKNHPMILDHLYIHETI